MSNTLTIRFHGLNTHFNREQNGNLGLPAAWRVLVPRFDYATQWGPETLPAHKPYIDFGGLPPAGLPEWFRPRPGGGYWLEGVTITVLHPGAPSLSGTSILCPPHLKAIWPEMELNADVVMKGHSPAAAYIDFDGGTLSELPHLGTAAVEVTFDYGEATVAILEVTRWPAGPSKTIEVSLPRIVAIENTGDRNDKEDDIVLNLYIAQTPPPAALPLLALIKGLAEQCVGASPGPRDLGIGCSNSQFP